MMPLLPDEMKKQVGDALAGIRMPVKLVIFTQTFECPNCQTSRQLLEEVAALSDQISVEVHDFVTDPEKVKEYAIDKIPAVAVVGERDYGLRFYGVPAGYEFTTLIHTVRMVGGAGSQLDEKVQAELRSLTQPVHMQVFVTPTCPFCPTAAAIAYEMAYVSPMIRTDVIESTEFPFLSVKYQIAGVPRTIINENTMVEGAATPDAVWAKIQEALAPVAEAKESADAS
jgi:glutaredoxin-like protein